MYTRAVTLFVIASLTIMGCATTPEAKPSPSAASSVAATSEAPSASATSTPTAAPTPTPVPTPDIKAIGQTYLAFSDFLREASTGIGVKLNDPATTDAEAAALYTEVAGIYSEAVKRLTTLELPDDLEDEQATIVTALTTAAAEFVKLAADPSYDPGTKITDAQAAVGTAGAAIREALGLPPPPTPKS